MKRLTKVLTVGVIFVVVGVYIYPECATAEIKMREFNPRGTGYYLPPASGRAEVVEPLYDGPIASGPPLPPEEWSPIEIVELPKSPDQRIDELESKLNKILETLNKITRILEEKFGIKLDTAETPEVSSQGYTMPLSAVEANVKEINNRLKLEEILKRLQREEKLETGE